MSICENCEVGFDDKRSSTKTEDVTKDTGSLSSEGDGRTMTDSTSSNSMVRFLVKITADGLFVKKAVN